MSTEKPDDKPAANSGAGPSSPANAGGNAQPGKSDGKNNRRRSLRNKRRNRKPGESSDAQARTGPREQSAPSRPADKNNRESRDRRRRRRMRAKQRGATESAPSPAEDILKDLPPLVPAFVYTHVLRPMVRDSFEFRTEHFSKVTRRLEDFHIDLTPLYPEGGDEIKSATYVPPIPPSGDEEETSWHDDRAIGDDEGDDDGEGVGESFGAGDGPIEFDGDAEVRTAAEESLDAARLEGATVVDLGLEDEADLFDAAGFAPTTALAADADLDFDLLPDEDWDPDEGDDLDALA